MNYVIVHWAPVGEVLSPWHFLLETRFWPLGGGGGGGGVYRARLAQTHTELKLEVKGTSYLSQRKRRAEQLAADKQEARPWSSQGPDQIPPPRL